LHFFSYKKIDNFYKPQFVNLLNDSVVNQSKVSSIYKDYYNDTICILNYRDKNQLLIWNIKQYNDVKLSQIIDTCKLELDQELRTRYVNVSESFVSLTIRNKLNTIEDKILINFNSNGKYKKIKHKKFLYFYLNCNKISFIVNKDYYDLKININPGSDFMICKSNGNFYIVLLYTLNGTYVNSDDLYKMINPDLYDKE